MTAHLRRRHRLARWFGLGVVGLVTVAVVVSAFLLVSSALGRGTSAPALLRDAALLWVINVATFAVWYWEIDGGGPARRRLEGHRSDDFLFPQTNLVTGASSGIGRAIALAFGREGTAVAVNYARDAEGADATVKEIEENGGKAVAVQADVSNEDDVKDLVGRAVTEFGRLDVMVNNADVEYKMPFLETPLETWEKVIAVNLTGPWLGCQEAARQMVSQGGPGRIINVSSVHEDLAMPTNTPYCAAKRGLRMLTRTIAVELAPHDITVNNVAPGAIETPMDAKLEQDPAKMDALFSEIPLGRMGKPEEVASLALYLASDASAYVTGSTLFVDGGMIRHSGTL